MLSPMVMVSSSGTGLLLKTLSGSMVFQHPGSEFMSMTAVTTEGLADGQGLVCYMRPCQTNYFQIFVATCVLLCLLLQRPSKSRRE